MHSLVSKLARSKGLKSAALMTFGNMASTAVAAIAMIIFSRTLGPSQFGVFSVLFSVMLILTRIGDLGINIAVSRAIAQNNTPRALATSYAQNGMFLKLIILSLIFLLGIIFAPFITTQLLNLDITYQSLTILVFTLSICIVIYEYVNSLLQAYHAFTLSVLTNTTQSLIKLALAGIAFYTSSITLSIIILGYLLIPLLGSLPSLLYLRVRELMPRYDKKVATEIFRVARWTSVAIIASTIAENIDVLIVQKFLTLYDTGIYAAATRIATVASLVGWSLGTVLNMRVAKYQNKSHLDKYLKKAVVLSIFSLIITLALILLSTPLVTYTVGHEYTDSISVLNILLLSTALLTATTPFVSLFYLFDYPRYFAISGLLTALSLIGFDIILIPLFGVEGAAWARVITRLLVIVYTLLIARSEYLKHYGKK